jgi:hypothetical protein
MRIIAPLVGALLAATPALALDNTNVGQPERLTTQSGQTTGGPIDTPPLSGGSADVVYGGPPVAVGRPGVVIVDPGPAAAGVVVVPVR